MSKYIYYDNNLRCKVSKAKFVIGEYELQLQKRSFLFWVNCFQWMIYEERKVDEKMFAICNLMRMSYQSGNRYEGWDEGTMTLKSRIKILFGEYFESLKRVRDWDKKFESI